METELNRKYDTVNMMITMHSILHYRYKNLSFVGNILFLISAIVLNFAVFADFTALGVTSFSKQEINNFVNIISFALLLLSIIFLIVDWGKKSTSHEQAVNLLSPLLTEIRRVTGIQDETLKSTQYEMLVRLYDQTFETIPKIPHFDFNGLKARHYHRLEFSKFVSNNKGKSFLIIKIMFFFRKNFSKIN